ncbi:ABC transporter ATP-binding protein [Salidesulfovibrio onnuriiensis]|uniref:ABC transporter ATP-binding protein n=1 Tax=Salidesulfovibrio onnuriiensis TaxID=2583823 RepID=UPI0011CB4339|nr:ATP-binding cassette domain-containing protein [Salidesulfovibrio onnuriiensis]
MSEQISIKGIAKAFNRGGVNEVQALDGIHVDISEGDFITIIGSNGAGKSTFLNALAGCFPLDAGTISLDGEDVTSWPEYRRAAKIGRVFQDPLLGTCAGATIEQNLALAMKRGKRRGLGLGVKRSHREFFAEKLALLGLGLEGRLKTATGLLSGGQRQALTMLMATMVRPRLLLLDEHTAALDPKTAQMILGLTEQLVAGQRLTTLMVTHNMQQAISMGNRLLMFHRGKVVMDIRGEEKKALTVEELLQRFTELRGEDGLSDRMLLC